MLTVEVGGSSVQAVHFDEFNDGNVVELGQHSTDTWLLAAPGLVEGNRVRGAHHLGWMDIQASEELGMSSKPILSMNDAEASALGEWWLHGEPSGVMLYVVMGTGVGAATVANHVVTPVEFGHLTSFGPNRCGGCGRVGCLDAQIGGHALPNPLDDHDIEHIIDLLGKAIVRQDVIVDSVVVGGGIPRRYPEIVEGLKERTEPPVMASACPLGYKSAAPFGLIHAWDQIQTITNNAV